MPGKDPPRDREKKMAGMDGNRTHLRAPHPHTGFEDQEGHQAYAIPAVTLNIRTRQRSARLFHAHATRKKYIDRRARAGNELH